MPRGERDQVLTCPRCGRITETIWEVTIGDLLLSVDRMCPGDVADLRLNGVRVFIGAIAEAA